MSEALQPLVSVDPDEEERFRVMIDARTRHADLWPLVLKLGSSKALANAIGMQQSPVGLWINLKSFPSMTAPKHVAAVEALTLMTGKAFDEMWPPAMRMAIVKGSISLRREVLIDTSLRMLAARTTERMMLPSPADELEKKEFAEQLGQRLSVVLDRLTYREREIMKLRFGLGEENGQTYTRPEVARIFRVSVCRVAQIEEKALIKLKSEANKLSILKDFKESL